MINSSIPNAILFPKIEQIQDTARLLSCARSLKLAPELCNGEPTGRSARWFGTQSELIDGGKSWRTFEASQPIKFWLFLAELRDQYYTKANSIAVYKYKYTTSSGIRGYQNRSAFSRKVVAVNLIETQEEIHRDKVSVPFRTKDYMCESLENGDVVAFEPIGCARPPSGEKGKVAPYATVATKGYLIQLRVLEM